MDFNNALGVFPRTEGVPLSGYYINRPTSVAAGDTGVLWAGAGGVSFARFGWAAPDGTVLNARSSAQDVLGLVVAEWGDWRKVFFDAVSNSWKIREGFPLTMLSAGPGMWVRFPSGTSPNAPVYTSPLDGVPVAGQSGGLEATPWVVAKAHGAGGTSLITTWNPRT